MASEQLFLLVIVVFVAVVVAIIQLSKNRHRIKHMVLNRLDFSQLTWRRSAHKPEKTASGVGPRAQTEEEKSKAELNRLEALIEDRKQIARESDISYHLWGFYKTHFCRNEPHSLGSFIQDGEWYDVKILQSSTRDGLNKFEFELQGARYTFVDDEENQGWGDKTKLFSLFLYDDSNRCLIEIPMKLKIDKWGRNYSILSNGPKAFLPGDWINNFINVKLKQQRIRNQEIREQKHQERLWEIEELKDRFGIPD